MLVILGISIQVVILFEPVLQSTPGLELLRLVQVSDEIIFFWTKLFQTMYWGYFIHTELITNKFMPKRIAHIHR